MCVMCLSSHIFWAPANSYLSVLETWTQQPGFNTRTRSLLDSFFYFSVKPVKSKPRGKITKLTKDHKRPKIRKTTQPEIHKKYWTDVVSEIEKHRSQGTLTRHIYDTTEKSATKVDYSVQTSLLRQPKRLNKSLRPNTPHTHTHTAGTLSNQANTRRLYRAPVILARFQDRPWYVTNGMIFSYCTYSG